MRDPASRALIGILGGMGPSATIDFVSKILAQTPAACDQEHVPLLIRSVPQIPDRSAAILARTDAPFPALLEGVLQLERAGVAAIAIACNTAHYWHPRLAAAVSIPILHIAQAVREGILARGRPIARLAVMGTRGTLAARFYDAALDGVVGAIVPPDGRAQDAIDRAIAGVKAGEFAQARAAAACAADRLLGEQGADMLLLACTELPLALDADLYGARCIDATLALARACVALSLEHAANAPGARPLAASRPA